jgi:hypothetical protein
MLCSHGVGTSHLEQAPSIKPNPSRISSRKAILLSRIAITPLTPPTYYRACPRRAILLCRSEYGDTKSIAAEFLLSYQPATDQSLDAEGTVAFLEEGTHGYSRLRFQAVAPGTRRFIYRHRLAGSNH